MDEDEDYEQVRYTEVYLDHDADSDRVKALLCLDCGLLVGAEPLHDNRCYGRQINREGDDIARMEYERLIEEGEFDEDQI